MKAVFIVLGAVAALLLAFLMILIIRKIQLKSRWFTLPHWLSNF